MKNLLKSALGGPAFLTANVVWFSAECVGYLANAVMYGADTVANNAETVIQWLSKDGGAVADADSLGDEE